MSGVAIRFEFDGKQREILSGGQVPLLIPGLQDMINEWIVRKKFLKDKETDLNSRLAEIQPLHWEVEAARANVGGAQAQVQRLLRLLLPGEEVDKWEGAFTLDVEKRALVFNPGRRDGA